jgi:hypothetical protein
MNPNKFGPGKIFGLIISFPFVLFLVFAFLYIPINLYQSSEDLLAENDINPWEEIWNDDWNPNPDDGSQASFGVKQILNSNLRVALETTLIVIIPAFIFSFILLYLSPSWIRSILVMLRNFLYLLPTILIAYLGYFYISPLILGEVGDVSGLLTSQVLVIFVFPYAVFGFMYGLEKIWPSINTVNPTFSGRVVKKNITPGKIVSLIFIIVIVALIIFTKVFGETVIFSVLSGVSAPESWADLSQPAQNVSSQVVNAISLSDTGEVLNGNFSLGIILFVTMGIFLVTLVVNTIANMAMALIGTIYNREARAFKTKFTKIPHLSTISKVIFSIIGLLFVAGVIYFLVVNIPEKTDTLTLLDRFPALNQFINSFEITGKSIFHFSLSFIGYSLLIGVPIGFFIGYIIKGSMMEHFIISIVRIFDNVPVLCIGIFGFSFFILGNTIESLNMVSAGLTTALFLAPKVSILTYEIIANSRMSFLAVKEERPYIMSGPYILSSFVKIIGTALQVYALMFGVVVTVLYTGTTIATTGAAPHISAPLLSYAQQMFVLMSDKAYNLAEIKPLLDNYYLEIIRHYVLFFIIGGGIKFIMSIIDSIRLREFHKQLY